MVNFEDNSDIEHLKFILFTIELLKKKKKKIKKYF
jgi:hypothetical protein